MPELLRSSKQSRQAAKARSHPYTRPSNRPRTSNVGIERSTSVFGTIKSLVTAPLQWLSLGGAQSSDDLRQKRRVSPAESSGTPPRAKRVRRDSPEPDEGVLGYLDPPISLFATKRPPIPLWDVANGVPPARTMPYELPAPVIRPTDVPLPPSRGPSMLSCASMSVEPQDKLSIRRSATRDLSMPPPSPFARSFSRSSLTPQPVGATFGPSPKRRTRESTAPPLLGSSTPTRTFSRSPQNVFPRVESRERSEGPILSLLGQTRQSVSPVRETLSRSLLISDASPIPRSPTRTTAERTLSTLESYRTPLIVARFPSAPLAEEHRPRKVHVPKPFKLGFDHTPDAKKDKNKRPPTIAPYSIGMSGMRKLLARRREELAQENEAEAEINGEQHTKVKSATGQSKENIDKEVVEAEEVEVENEEVLASKGRNLETTAFKSDTGSLRSPRSSKVDTYSSLRAPTSRVRRTHAPAPRSKKPTNKFSLKDDDDEPEWGMSVEELKKYQAKVQSNKSFSISRRMSEAGMQTDILVEDSRMEAPPLPAQPQTFDSLLSRIGPAPNNKSPAEFPAEATKTDSASQTIVQISPHSGASSAPSKLPFSLGTGALPPMPKADDVVVSAFASPSLTSVPSGSASPAPATSAAGGVPSFFANTKAVFTIPDVPTGTLFGGHISVDQGAKPTVQPVLAPTKEDAQPPKEDEPSPFSASNKTLMFGQPSTSPFGNASATTDFPSSSTNAASTGSAEALKPAAFQFNPTTTSVVPKPPINIFGATSKPDTTTTATTPTTFLFGAPTVETPETGTANKDAPKSVFMFGAPSSTPSDINKSPFTFGSSTQAKGLDLGVSKPPFSFGSSPSTPPLADKKPSFTLGTTGGTGAMSDTPKSVFGFGNSTSTPVPSTPQPVDAMVENGDGMEVAGDRMEESPTRTVEKKDTPSVQQFSQSSPFASFGSSGTSTGFSFGQNKISSNNTTGSGSFTFGQSKPTLSTNSFSFGQDNKPAPSTTSFSFGQSKPPTTSNGFTFGQPGSPGGGTATGFAFGTDTPKTTGQPAPLFGGSSGGFGSASANTVNPSPFSFGQTNTSSTTTNPLGQTKQPENGASTAPNSPSLFPSQPVTSSPSFPFRLPGSVPAFGTPTTDAVGASSSSSGVQQPFQFGAGTSQTQQPGATPGNTMFTLGGAATPSRKMKGLPTRRAKRP